jgi:hypothetical protein
MNNAMHIHLSINRCNILLLRIKKKTFQAVDYLATIGQALCSLPESLCSLSGGFSTVVQYRPILSVGYITYRPRNLLII